MYNIPIVKPSPTPIQRLFSGLQGGLQSGLSIANALQQASANRRQQAFQQQMQPLQLQQLQAKINYMPQKYKQDAERLAIQERVNSPEQLASQLDYRQALTKSAPARALSSMGKGIHEQANVAQGKTVTGAPLPAGTRTPEQTNLLLKQFDLSRIKQTTDSWLRQSLVQANSIDNTLKSINFKDISKFYGPKGRLLAAREAANVSTGNAPSPEYQQYLNFNNVTGPGAVGQIRKFLQDSVTQGASKKLEGIVFPSKWGSNPITAQSQWKALLKLYDIEKRSRHTAMVSPDIFLGTAGQRQPATAPQAAQTGIAPAAGVQQQAPQMTNQQLLALAAQRGIK